MRNKKLNILSLFDGMSTLQLAMKNVGIPIGKYYASEIKPYAIKLVNHHFPSTIQLGDIRNWKSWDINWSEIDFIGSGSPCQDLSIAGKRAGIYGSRSSLFFTFIEILNHVRKYNPNVIFLQENVASASKKDIAIISKELGILPQLIDSRKYIPQSRKRLYWTNIRTKKVGLFGDIKTDIRLENGTYPVLQNVLTSGKAIDRISYALLEGYYNSYNYANNISKNHILLKKRNRFKFTIVEENINGKIFYRLLNRVEMERVQGFPDGYTNIVSINQASSLLGDAWTLPVIEQILKNLTPIRQKTAVSDEKPPYPAENRF